MQFHLEFIGTVQSESIIYSSLKNGKTWKSCEIFCGHKIWSFYCVVVTVCTDKKKEVCVFISFSFWRGFKIAFIFASFFDVINNITFFKFIFSNLSNSQSTYQRRLLVTRSGRKIKGRGPRVKCLQSVPQNNQGGSRVLLLVLLIIFIRMVDLKKKKKKAGFMVHHNWFGDWGLKEDKKN